MILSLYLANAQTIKFIPCGKFIRYCTKCEFIKIIQNIVSDFEESPWEDEVFGLKAVDTIGYYSKYMLV